MAVTVILPPHLQKFNADQAMVECGGHNVFELIESLEVNCPGIKTKMCRQDGLIHAFLNVYINDNDEDIRFMNRHETLINNGDRVLIKPAQLP
jgi:sulfur-carrier protein